MERSFSLDELTETAAWFWQQAGEGTVFAFHGEMGAGKTTLIQALCRALGVEDVTGSPTFSIINEYQVKKDGFKKAVYHMDLFRLNSAAEAVQAGVEDCFYSGDPCLVEWPERAEGIFPEKTIHVYLKILDSLNRKLQIERN